MSPLRPAAAPDAAQGAVPGQVSHDHDVALLAVILGDGCAVCLEEALATLHPLVLVEVRDVVVAAVHRHVPSATRAWAG